MLNFLSLLGWNDGTEQEIYAPQELTAKFSLDRITKSAAVFDKTKLSWMNGGWRGAGQVGGGWWVAGAGAAGVRGWGGQRPGRCARQELWSRGGFDVPV